MDEAAFTKESKVSYVCERYHRPKRSVRNSPRIGPNKLTRLVVARSNVEVRKAKTCCSSCALSIIVGQTETSTVSHS